MLPTMWLITSVAHIIHTILKTPSITHYHSDSSTSWTSRSSRVTNEDKICPCPQRIIGLKMGAEFIPVPSVLLAWKWGQDVTVPSVLACELGTIFIPVLSVLLSWKRGQDWSLSSGYWPENGDRICPCPWCIISLKIGNMICPCP
jgi:hypothetical protein